MSTQTEHIGLHQWESTDPFLREDFNEDNRKIDEKVKAAQALIEQTAGGLETMSYNVYNLLLQNYYEGKYTGFRRGLMFDGFLDGSRIVSWEGSAYRDTAAHTVSIDTVGQSSVPEPSVRSNGESAGPQKYITRQWTAQGCGTITAAAVNGCGMSNDHTAALSIWKDGKKLADADEQLLFEEGSAVWQTFSITCAIRKGEVYEFRIQNTSALGTFGSLFCSYEDDDSLTPVVALALTVTPAGSQSGVLHSSTEEIGAWGNAICYVRHSGRGQLSAALSGVDGSWESMDQMTSLPAETMDGLPCTETTFSLALSAPETAAALRLSLSAGTGEIPVVYDYGVIFLK